jgi:hypothetical protein
MGVNRMLGGAQELIKTREPRERQTKTPYPAYSIQVLVEELSNKIQKLSLF